MTYMNMVEKDGERYVRIADVIALLTQLPDRDHRRW